MIPCVEELSDSNPGGTIRMGTAARVENLRSKLPRYRCDLGCILLKIAAISLLTGGACVDGLVGDCGGVGDDGPGGCKADGFGEMSYAAVRAIGAYRGPEEVSDDPIRITIGVMPDPIRCVPAPPPPPPGTGH